MILVTGATGNVGRNVVRQLVAEGADVRTMSRNPDRAAQPEGVEVVRGDLQQPETVARALDGVSTVYLFPVHGAMDAFVEQALAAGVRRVVLLSADAVSWEDQDNGLAAFHGDNERAVRDSSLQWTILRPGAFAANALQWAPAIAGEGVVRAPYGDAESTPIHERDIAAVAVRALLDDGHEGAIYRLSGPESLSTVDQVQLIGDAIGRNVRFEEQSPETAREEMVAGGAPPPIVDTLLKLWAGAVGQRAPVLHTVREITGTPARTFAQWATDHAASFR